MKTLAKLLLTIAGTSTLLSTSGCMTQEARTARVEARQDRIDSRSNARADRWAIRSEREDARIQRRWDAY